MASLAAQDMIIKVGLAMDYEGTEAVARAIRDQAKAYRRLADRMDQAADDISASVAQHRADVATAEAAAEQGEDSEPIDHGLSPCTLPGGALNLRGEHYPCVEVGWHKGWPHRNPDAEAVWSSGTEPEQVQHRADVAQAEAAAKAGQEGADDGA